MSDLGGKQQFHLVGDIFEIYFNEHVIKSKGVSNMPNVEDDFLLTICQLLNQYGEAEKKVAILEKVVKQCVSQEFQEHNEQICLMIGRIYLDQQYCSKAYSYLLRGNDIPGCITALKQVMKSGYHGEQDLFVFRLCCEILIRNYRKKSVAIDGVRAVLAAFYDNERVFNAPLVNMMKVLVECLRLDGELEEDAIMKELIGIYKPQLMRDPAFLEYLDRITRYYFDFEIKQANPMQQMLANMMGGGSNNQQ